MRQCRFASRITKLTFPATQANTFEWCILGSFREYFIQMEIFLKDSLRKKRFCKLEIVHNPSSVKLVRPEIIFNAATLIKVIDWLTATERSLTIDTLIEIDSALKMIPAHLQAVKR